MAAVPMLAGVGLMMVCCSSSSMASMMMGGEDFGSCGAGCGAGPVLPKWTTCQDGARRHRYLSQLLDIYLNLAELEVFAKGGTTSIARVNATVTGGPAVTQLDHGLT